MLAGGVTACIMAPDHDVGCVSPEPDISVPHHLPEMDTDTPRYSKVVVCLSCLPRTPYTNKAFLHGF